MNAPRPGLCAVGLTVTLLWACSSSAHDDGPAGAQSMNTGGASASGTGGAAPHAIKDAADSADSGGVSQAPDASPADASPADASPADASPVAGGCDAAGLTWKTANKTNYTSYPDPGSVECIEYSGCEYEGLFAACDDKKSKSWVMSHDIVAAFPDFDSLRLHDLCLRSGTKTIVVTVLDTCGDDDCDGCCTENKGSADELIDVESFTNARWGVEDGPIEWADLGPSRGDGCE